MPDTPNLVICNYHCHRREVCSHGRPHIEWRSCISEDTCFVPVELSENYPYVAPVKIQCIPVKDLDDQEVEVQ